tara:strand:+ start:11043 stop:11951 length:909 start_codon:yes stop_codon:yes gene_type:complete
MNFQYELFENLKRTARLQITTLSVIVCCLFILLTLFTVQSNLDKIFSAWTQNVQVTAYIKNGLEKNQISKIEKQIKKNESVAKVRFVDKEEYKKQFDEKLIQAMPKLKALQSIENPFLNGFEIVLDGLSSVSGLKQYLEKLELSLIGIEGIQEISYGKIWINEYSRLAKFISYSSLFIIFALLLSIAFIIGNAVKTLLESRRKEIHIMSILGATDKTIFTPFYMNILLLLFAGFSISLVLSLLFKLLMEKMFVQHLSLLGIQISFPSAMYLSVLFLLVGLFSFLGSHFHLVRMSNNRYNYDV